MSETPPPIPNPPRAAPPALESPRTILAAFLVVGGILLLLPGLCMETIFGFELHKPNDPTFIVVLFNVALLGTALAVVGIVIGLSRLIAGVILLLPGACTVVATGGHIDLPAWARITPITFTIGFIGLVLILIGVVRR